MIPDLEIKKGEHPLDAHSRLTQAAFFPVRKVAQEMAADYTAMEAHCTIPHPLTLM